MTYADTSALVKLLVPERESAELAAYLAAAPERTTSSELTIAELTRTVSRWKARTTETQHPGVPADPGLLLRQLDLLSIDEASLWRAGRLPSPAGTFLRTADAIHLGAAMELGETRFLTYDRRQAQAAADRGFAVVAPGRPDGWYA